MVAGLVVFCGMKFADKCLREKAKANSVSGNFKENDDYEKVQFYYHPDHLGCSSYITNLVPRLR
jgi:hypothetical protein